MQLKNATKFLAIGSLSEYNNFCNKHFECSLHFITFKYIKSSIYSWLVQMVKLLAALRRMFTPVCFTSSNPRSRQAWLWLPFIWGRYNEEQLVYSGWPLVTVTAGWDGHVPLKQPMIHTTSHDFLAVSTDAFEILLKYLRRIRNARF